MELNKIYQGDSWALAEQLDDESVDCVVTSPPYWGLRDYGVEGQAGHEQHPQEWVNKMVDLCKLLRPKLKSSGTMWWNIGETYFANRVSDETFQTLHINKKSGHPHSMRQAFDGKWLQPKQMLGLPWRFAITMQDDGWILRNAIIWQKPNHMPSSVRDRMSNSYEYVFLFVKNRKYWFDLDNIREPHKFPNDVVRHVYEDTLHRLDTSQKPERKGNLWRTEPTRYDKTKQSQYSNRQVAGFNERWKKKEYWKANNLRAVRGGSTNPDIPNPAGKNPGDVWSITTKPHPFAHFAVFPEELAERCIKAGCPLKVCMGCGKPRNRIIKKLKGVLSEVYAGKGKKEYEKNHIQNPSDVKRRTLDAMRTENKTIGWSDCGCKNGFVEGVVLDPFMGSGTVAVVAKNFGRKYIGFELNEEYIEIAKHRINGVKDWGVIKDIKYGKQKTLEQTGERNSKEV
jgi:site-specific DNA-methyltransferase (cytosine-N4-specific)